MEWFTDTLLKRKNLAAESHGNFNKTKQVGFSIA